jgi:hypothetical protein
VAASIQLKRGSTTFPQREGSAPVRERLTAMLLLTALLHAIVILGISFSNGPRIARSPTPELDVMLVTDEVPEARANERASYLAQRTQIGAGNTDQAQRIASPASRGALSNPRIGDPGNDQANSRRVSPWERQVLTSTGDSPEFRYIGEVAASSGAAPLPLIIGESEGDPRSGRGDAVGHTRYPCLDTRALPGGLETQGRARGYLEFSCRCPQRGPVRQPRGGSADRRQRPAYRGQCAPQQRPRITR